MSRSHNKLPSNRIFFFSLCLLIATSLVAYRLFRLTIVGHAEYKEIAENQQKMISIESLNKRGNIFAIDRSIGEKKLLAVSQKNERHYPLGLFAAQTLGFVGFHGYQRVGQYGVEGYYNDKLKGQDGVLTLDPNIQSDAEATLNALLKRWSSPSGTIIVEDPATGAIFAMTSSPSFDPNRYGDFSLDKFINPAVQEQFEPGSSFKPVTMSAAIDSGAVTPATTYDDTGVVTIGGYTIKNFNEKANGIQTMSRELGHSLNTGTLFGRRKTGEDNLLKYRCG